MYIFLHPDLEKCIRDLVHPDGYRSPDEVVTEALFLLWQRDQADDAGSQAGTCLDGRH
jgi:hypothetical protein